MDMIANLNNTRKFLKERLQRDISTFHGHLAEWKNVRDLIKRTSETGESNSILLVGPRGCGKSTLITSVLHSLLADDGFCKNTLFASLNGLVHTDDRLALKSITVQLSLANAVEGKVFGSFSENLAFLLACLKSGHKKSKSVVFFLDEFDLFCNHHNQTLLYNLFDVAQSAQAPICVVGITCRLDVIELLEKRVKSRFSHRQIFLFPKQMDIEERMSLFQEFLSLPNATDVPRKQKIISSGKLEQFSCLENLFNSNKYKFSKSYADMWNSSVKKLCENQQVRACIQQLYEYDVCQASMKMFLYRLVSRLNANCPLITPEDVLQIATSYDEESKVVLLCGLSVLELCLVIAMKHHSEIYDRDPFNFEIILSRFSKFAKSSTSMQTVERPMVLKAYEYLKNLEIIVPANNIATKAKKEFQMHKMLLTYGQIKQALVKYQALPTEVSQWAQSSLI